jgi:C-terminal processing protease CtpA/Prc
MNEIFPYLFAERTPLVKMEIARAIYDKEGTPFPEGPAMSFDKGPAKVTATHYAIPNDSRSLRKAKIYLLVSNATVSAAEHFALAMKSTGRATLIGEATGGANHFGGPVPLNDHFAVWLPIGRTYDIKTGKDWEGDGVAPDIAVDPTQALVVALERAGVSHADAVRLDAQEVPAEPVHRDQLRAR